MKKQRVLKYRWVVLFAIVSCGLLAIAIALGVPHREGITPSVAFIPFAMLLVVSIPLCVTRIVKHRWATPIEATWCFPAIIAIHFIGTRLMGLGHQCDDLVLTACITGFCFTNAVWIIGEGRQWRARDKPKTKAVVLQQGLLPS